MDNKRLHDAIKELRAELEQVNLAIQRIEGIAASVLREQEAVEVPSEPSPGPAESGDDEES